ncbi:MULTISPECIES: hypothetical protein [Methanosarcina]|uniref:Uncharacterized protein n=1 Tax=Methanosarcina barkeri CM1 TaxID=796385 RepID=A0A0G3CB78_METBA|nr:MULTISPECIES: hypothetical protein [Methanosarcina]AKJ37198.1 hypothetical protein MCM1_0072 [Methanosarcina barkeri CM1]OEC91082.1 hypothetical protein A9239_03685 [Methanosarcina sp. A14]
MGASGARVHQYGISVQGRISTEAIDEGVVVQKITVKELFGGYLSKMHVQKLKRKFSQKRN